MSHGCRHSLACVAVASRAFGQQASAKSCTPMGEHARPCISLVSNTRRPKATGGTQYEMVFKNIRTSMLTVIGYYAANSGKTSGEIRGCGTITLTCSDSENFIPINSMKCGGFESWDVECF